MANRNWRKGDRIVINYEGNARKPEYYIGTVSRGGASKVTVEFDDGDVKSYSVDDKYIVGEGVDKKRKSEIPKAKLDQYLIEEPKKTVKKTTKKTTKTKKVETPKTEEVKQTVKTPPKNFNPDTWPIPEGTLSHSLHGDPAVFAKLYNKIQELRSKTTKQQRQKFHRGERLTKAVKERVERLEAMERYFPETHPMWKEAENYIKNSGKREKKQQDYEKKLAEFKRLQLAKMNRMGFRIGDEVTMLATSGVPFEKGKRLIGTVQQDRKGVVYVKVGNKKVDFFNNPWESLEEFEEEQRKKEVEKNKQKTRKQAQEKKKDSEPTKFESIQQMSELVEHLMDGGTAQIPERLFNELKRNIGPDVHVKVITTLRHRSPHQKKATRWRIIKLEESAPEAPKKASELDNLEFTGKIVSQSPTQVLERGQVKIDGRLWKARRKILPNSKYSMIYLEEQRFMPGDEISRPGDYRDRLFVVEVTRDNKDIWRYTSSTGSWLRDMFGTDKSGKTMKPLVKIGKADFDTLDKKKNELEENKQQSGKRLKDLVDRGVLAKGMEVRYKSGVSPMQIMKTGIIEDFNFRSGRIKVRPEYGKSAWVKHVWYPGGHWSVN